MGGFETCPYIRTFEFLSRRSNAEFEVSGVPKEITEFQYSAVNAPGV